MDSSHKVDFHKNIVLSDIKEKYKYININF